MIILPGDLSIDLRAISHSKNLQELFDDDETEAFLFGIHYPAVVKYIGNINLKKKNVGFYNEIMSINLDTIDYVEDMLKLIDEYIDDGEESLMGVINYIIGNLNYVKEIDKYKMSFVLGIYAVSGELERILKEKLDPKGLNNNV